jgi:tripeptide aminopeptidase
MTERAATARTTLTQIVDDLIAVAQIPAPTSAEGERIEWLEERLRASRGARWRDDVGNFVWSIGDGEPDLLLTAHVDTVFDADTRLEVTRDEDIVRGPGVGDNAAAIAVAINVFENPANDVSATLAFTVGEEGLGNLRGASEAIAALTPRAVIALEGHGLDRVIVDSVGSLRARVTVRGTGGHPWVDYGTPSALHSLLELGAELTASASEELVVNVGTVSGGRSINSIADRGELLVEARSLHPKLLERFAENLACLQVPAPLDLELEIVGHRPAGRLDRRSRLLRVVLDVRDELGLGRKLDAGSTDANAAVALGIPAMALGVANGAGMHTPREWIDLRSLAVGRDQVERALTRLAGARAANLK